MICKRGLHTLANRMGKTVGIPMSPTDPAG
ncbi:hypothetical protein D2E22_0423 [Bifidobacterium castoris]|uniref:Uncharacterized protein n=1 Tax=Bifidobacterium castoris TaxID=2306972 RepID=A0A430FAU1_9BIFI|nr:hypothetical protein D2E22_0423 [Bifidobacterium castoris]